MTDPRATRPPAIVVRHLETQPQERIFPAALLKREKPQALKLAEQYLAEQMAGILNGGPAASLLVLHKIERDLIAGLEAFGDDEGAALKHFIAAEMTLSLLLRSKPASVSE